MSNTFDWTRYATGGATRPDSFTGMKPEFRSALEQLFTAAPADLGLQVGSGYRSIERQRQLWEASDKSGRMVARPGGSRHNHGDAADLSAAGLRLDKASPAARQWVHDNAAQYGLTFPMSWEPWHVELVGARGGKGVAVRPAGTSTAALSATPIAQQMTPNAGPAPAVLGDLVGQNQVQTTAVDGAPAAPVSFGDLAASFFSNQQERQSAKREQEAADAARKAALFGGSLFGMYA